MIRVGQGFDIHRFSSDPERPLILGGVTITDAQGLEGHSDADVVTHALIDALLGAAGLGDIGEHFSDSDASLEGISSLAMLDVTIATLAELGFKLGNADITVVAQVPKLGTYKELIARTLSDALGAPVSVKATTMEQLGPLGAGEGMAALCVALVEQL
jgi:2-C-methyl-D-erythritol 2,4-cyclodiphosphate synthase